ncbi:hypothetical protein BD410DRAFT_792778 [Rickenella mellea]|uniref:Uncharacterized protein n=1 Tax=Rickenella mellea TaxID=50990 RepID=A0A4Y7PTR0_9AGAM|nr:hypothetical protein BD410DRAFT_792778 [Rickenella mellea]
MEEYATRSRPSARGSDQLGQISLQFQVSIRIRLFFSRNRLHVSVSFPQNVIFDFTPSIPFTISNSTRSSILKTKDTNTTVDLTFATTKSRFPSPPSYATQLSHCFGGRGDSERDVADEDGLGNRRRSSVHRDQIPITRSLRSSKMKILCRR